MDGATAGPEATRAAFTPAVRTVLPLPLDLRDGPFEGEYLVVGRLGLVIGARIVRVLPTGRRQGVRAVIQPTVRVSCSRSQVNSGTLR